GRAGGGGRRRRAGLRKPAPVALSVVSPGDVAGLAPDNSASAELGLALALLMFTCQSTMATVIATGALDLNSDAPDAPVRPIHFLRAKFSLVHQYFSQAGAPSPPAFFFIPEKDVDG